MSEILEMFIRNYVPNEFEDAGGFERDLKEAIDAELQEKLKAQRDEDRAVQVTFLNMVNEFVETGVGKNPIAENGFVMFEVKNFNKLMTCLNEIVDKVNDVSAEITEGE